MAEAAYSSECPRCIVDWQGKHTNYCEWFAGASSSQELDIGQMMVQLKNKARLVKASIDIIESQLDPRLLSLLAAPERGSNDLNKHERLQFADQVTTYEDWRYHKSLLENLRRKHIALGHLHANKT
jgi:hypothetical protein